MLNGLTVYIVRHGQTDWNLERRLQGTTDTPLNDTGREQARRQGRALAALGLDWSALDFHASPLARAAETMAIIRDEIGEAAPEPKFDPRLVEGAFGTWEGRTWQDIAREEPDAHQTFLKRSWNEAPHGGESYSDIGARLTAWAGDLTRDTLVVAHGGVSRVLRGLYLKLPPDEILELSTPQTKFHRLRDGQVDAL